MQPVTHREAEARGLALHAEVARRVRSEPELVAQARRRLEGWVERGALARPWAQAWADVLAKPVDEIIAVLTDPGEWACSLRQSSAVCRRPRPPHPMGDPAPRAGRGRHEAGRA